jgi:hypothetical protein
MQLTTGLNSSGYSVDGEYSTAGKYYEGLIACGNNKMDVGPE